MLVSQPPHHTPLFCNLCRVTRLMPPCSQRQHQKGPGPLWEKQRQVKLVYQSTNSLDETRYAALIRGPIISLVSSALLRINDDDQLINSWKKRSDSNVKIKSHYEWKYWLTLHANWTELNFRFNWIGFTLNWIELKYIKWKLNPIQFNSIIGLRFNWIVLKFNF
jgi:hypothetical protein